MIATYYNAYCRKESQIYRSVQRQKQKSFDRESQKGEKGNGPGNFYDSKGLDSVNKRTPG